MINAANDLRDILKPCHFFCVIYVRFPRTYKQFTEIVLGKIKGPERRFEALPLMQTTARSVL